MSVFANSYLTFNLDILVQYNFFLTFVMASINIISLIIVQPSIVECLHVSVVFLPPESFWVFSEKLLKKQSKIYFLFPTYCIASSKLNLVSWDSVLHYGQQLYCENYFSLKFFVSIYILKNILCLCVVCYYEEHDITLVLFLISR